MNPLPRFRFSGTQCPQTLPLSTQLFLFNSPNVENRETKTLLGANERKPKPRRLSGHSKTLSRSIALHSVREVLECGSPMPLSVLSSRCAVPFLGLMLLSGVWVLLINNQSLCSACPPKEGLTEGLTGPTGPTSPTRAAHCSLLVTYVNVTGNLR
jgi:hypothetical protein